MAKRIKELEELAEFLSISIARKRESFDRYMKAYDKSTRANANETVQNLLWLLVKQEKEALVKLREQLHELKMEIMITRGPHEIRKRIVIKAPPQELYNRSARMARIHAQTLGLLVAIEGEIDLGYKDERVVWRTLSGDIAMFSTINLKTVAEGTEVNYKVYYEAPYPILGGILEKLKTRKALGNSMMGALRDLKKQVERK